MCDDEMFVVVCVDSDGYLLNGVNCYVLYFVLGVLLLVCVFWMFMLYMINGVLFDVGLVCCLFGDCDWLCCNYDGLIDIVVLVLLGGMYVVNWLLVLCIDFVFVLCLYVLKL